MRKIAFIASLCLPLALAATPSAAATNLIINGSFETPVQADKGYTDYLVGSNGIPNWQITGIAGTYVSVLNQNYAGNPGYTFPAQDGVQWLDLAGFSDNAPDGVSQTVATVIGTQYDFSFYVGNISGGAFGTQSAVVASFSSGGTTFTCTNTADTFKLTWQLCTQRFTATSATTTFTLTNADPRNDFSNAVDNVSLFAVAAPGSVPEPATWAMLVAGFAAIGGTLRRRRARPATVA